jgi:hypothetical protein
MARMLTGDRIDALTLGPRKEVPKHEMASPPNSDGTPDVSFHLRPLEEFIKDSPYRAEWFKILAPHLRIAIGSARIETQVRTMANQPIEKIGGVNLHLNAVTRTLLNDVGILIVIHIHILEPLLRGDLTQSERLSQQNHVAIIVSHEHPFPKQTDY